MKRFAYIALLICLLLSSPLFAGGNSEKAKTLVFADLSWDSAMVHNRIAAFIIENGLDGITNLIL